MATAGIIVITVQSEYSGDNSTFFFVVVVTNENSTIVHNMSYEGLSYRRISLPVSIGRYFVTVTGHNKFGISDRSSETAEVPTSIPSSACMHFSEL